LQQHNSLFATLMVALLTQPCEMPIPCV